MKEDVEKIKELLEETIQESKLFLVDLYIKPTLNIKIFLDGDDGVTVQAITEVNRTLYKKIEEAELYEPGTYSLEVSSAGLEHPLRMYRQYKKNIGRQVKITLNDEELPLIGMLQEVEESHIVISYEEGKKKKDKVVITKEILFENIKETIVQAII